MSWIVAACFVWFCTRLAQALWAAHLRRKERAPLRYAFDARRNWSLALAHPMADAGRVHAFANPKAPGPSPEDAQALRASVLHVLGLRNTLSDTELRAALESLMRREWFRIGLDKLRPEDDPRAALALASARLAFAVRMATLLGWLDPDLQWQVLYQNAQRLNNCFDSWDDYASAWSRGRQQWLAASRADSLGLAFSEADVKAWLADARHPWRKMPWQTDPLFVPPART